MQEVRCLKCHKKLGMIEGISEIKCPRCGEMNVTKGERQMHPIIINYEFMRKVQHQAIDQVIDETIARAKEYGDKNGVIVCTSEEEYDQVNTK